MRKQHTFPLTPDKDLVTYLHRLGVTEKTPDLTLLQELHRAHLEKIPFENLDIMSGRIIPLDVHAAFEKIIVGHRGGFCFELNLLFYHLLKELGYNCNLASARAWNGGKLGPEFDHMMVIVHLADRQYLVDVGYGKLFTEPIPLIDYQIFYDQDTATWFNLHLGSNGIFILNRSADNQKFRPVYQFSVQPRKPDEFRQMCLYHQVSEGTHFNKRKLITQQFPEGRITLTDRMIKIDSLENPRTLMIRSEAEFLEALEKYFGIREALCHPHENLVILNN